ncbi:AmmeMemoRadiSam system protein B [Pseudothauera lacus]|uniref:MEMO1 family protein C8261_00665 n=1 Tax=Pseudothauera lacus TaxID=2136175 RepID=A0A2T4IJL1_9RHOO|nr:AmmeMemoRadiSam system protein B [Pseudothauera lacus]PTD97967.1 AmmeMemoRadiSam system protein B [Pseudothauera lacus]
MASAAPRPPAVAGQFYPADPLVLRAQIDELLACALGVDEVVAPKALIVPHAGYIYSGAVAACAYATLTACAPRIRRVIMLGPTHRVAVNGFALPAARGFATPLGTVAVAHDDWLAVQRRGDVIVDDRPHAAEHCLEVQLPFLQRLLGAFEVLPLLVGNAQSEAVAEVLDALWGGDETLVVVSSDLSHYLSYPQSCRYDRATVDEILHLHATLDHHQACGATPINGLLRVAARRGLQAHLLDLRNSGDTAGDRNRVVGYAALAFCKGNAHERFCH